MHTCLHGQLKYRTACVFKACSAMRYYSATSTLRFAMVSLKAQTTQKALDRRELEVWAATTTSMVA